MEIEQDVIRFSRSDMPFVKRFGVLRAAEMVLDFKATHGLPFVYDTYQLSELLRIQRKELFRLTGTADEHYRLITLKKKNGQDRMIRAPKAELKWCQSRILKEILVHLPVSPYATAYVRHKTLADNAAPHVGKRYLLKLDITDFFGNIRFDQVYSAAFHTRYFPKQIGVMLTALCCRKEVLPQGAPTSPALSNLVMRHFDNSMGAWCKKHGIAYTRYCDDMTFSSDSPLWPVYEKAKAMLEDMGFELNGKKTRFVTAASRQSVTGLTVNDKVAVSGEYKRRLRQQVYYALKFGYEDAILHAGLDGFMLQGVVPETERYRWHLIGRVNYVLQIEPENTWFREALEELMCTEQ